jgi:hypothetical protein
LGDLGVDGRIIEKWILRKEVVGAWARFNRLRIEWASLNETWGCVKGRAIF